MSHLRIFLGTSAELHLTLAALLLGGFLGSVYDLLRALRRTVKHHPKVVAAEDVAFCLLFGAGYYCFCLSLCGGALRGFILIAMLIGFLVYIYTLGIIICDFLSLTFSLAVEIVKRVVGVIIWSIKILKNRKKSSSKA